MRYKISIMGYECTLALGMSLERYDEYAISLSQDTSCDFSLYDAGKRPLEDGLVRLVLSWFFGSLRAYPEMQLDFSCSDSRFSVDIFPDSVGRVRLKLPECKLLCTNSIALSDRVSLNVLTVGAQGCRIRVTECLDVLNFNRERLSELRFISGLPDCDGAYAIESEGESFRCIGSKDAPAAAFLALLSYLSIRGAERVYIGDGCAELHHGGFVSLPVSFLSLS